MANYKIEIKNSMDKFINKLEKAIKNSELKKQSEGIIQKYRTQKTKNRMYRKRTDRFNLWFVGILEREK